VISIPRICTFGLLCLALLSSACSKGTTDTAAVAQDQGPAVTCIAVLPAVSFVNFDETVPVAQAKQLANGLHVLDRVMEKQFVGRSDIRLVSDGQLSGMSSNLPAEPLARARVVGDRLSCNAVLETTLRRYKDRVGGEYTAKDPASVAFDYRLIGLPDGAILCRGSFDEVQKSVMENLYNFKSATERGFTWVTAEQLMQEGLQARLGECRYFNEDE
jgi:hypothetical protein